MQESLKFSVYESSCIRKSLIERFGRSGLVDLRSNPNPKVYEYAQLSVFLYQRLESTTQDLGVISQMIELVADNISEAFKILKQEDPISNPSYLEILVVSKARVALLDPLEPQRANWDLVSDYLAAEFHFQHYLNGGTGEDLSY